MIDISVHSVTLDLGGFRIAGPSVCSGVPVSSCTALGGGVGVNGGNDVTVKNGTITGMGGAAVNLTYSARIEGLNVFHCGGGVVATDLAVIRGNIVTSGNDDGIGCRDYCVVAENTSTGHRGDGIEVRNGTVNGNTASLNGGRGGFFSGAAVSYGLNSFSGNTLADVDGGHVSAGNTCADGRCSRRGARRFYLTTSTFNGSQASTACAAGFHFASIWEVFDVSTLEYDTTRGQTSGDGPEGPPIASGWMRGGAAASSSELGAWNCSGWMSQSANGTVASLSSPDAFPGGGVFEAPLWKQTVQFCTAALSVWCVED